MILQEWTKNNENNLWTKKLKIYCLHAKGNIFRYSSSFLIPLMGPQPTTHYLIVSNFHLMNSNFHYRWFFILEQSSNVRNSENWYIHLKFVRHLHPIISVHYCSYHTSHKHDFWKYNNEKNSTPIVFNNYQFYLL